MNKKIWAIVVAAVVVVVAAVFGILALFGNFKVAESGKKENTSNSSSQISEDDKNNGSESTSDKSDDTSSVQVTDDGIVTVPVVITKNPGMVAAQVFLEYDADTFDYVDCKNGKILDEFDSAYDKGTVNCLLTANLEKSSKDVKTNGTLFTLKLKVKENAKSGNYTVKVNKEKTQFANYNEQFVNPEIKIDTIKVK